MPVASLTGSYTSRVDVFRSRSSTFTSPSKPMPKPKSGVGKNTGNSHLTSPVPGRSRATTAACPPRTFSSPGSAVRHRLAPWVTWLEPSNEKAQSMICMATPISASLALSVMEKVPASPPRRRVPNG